MGLDCLCRGFQKWGHPISVFITPHSHPHCFPTMFSTVLVLQNLLCSSDFHTIHPLFLISWASLSGKDSFEKSEDASWRKWPSEEEGTNSSDFSYQEFDDAEPHFISLRGILFCQVKLILYFHFGIRTFICSVLPTFSCFSFLNDANVPKSHI